MRPPHHLLVQYPPPHTDRLPFRESRLHFTCPGNETYSLKGITVRSVERDAQIPN
jgi:hypothetical protein